MRELRPDLHRLARLPEQLRPSRAAPDDVRAGLEVSRVRRWLRSVALDALRSDTWLRGRPVVCYWDNAMSGLDYYGEFAAIAPLLARRNDLRMHMNMEPDAWVLPPDVLPGVTMAYGLPVIRADVPRPMMAWAAGGTGDTE